MYTRAKPGLKSLAFLVSVALLGGCGTQATTAPQTAAPGTTAPKTAAPATAAPATAAPATAAAVHDTLIIAVPALPPVIGDGEQTTTPQFWTMGNQVFADGLKYSNEPYPYTEAIGDPKHVEGFTYPVLDFSKLQPGILDSCTLSADGLTATVKIRQGVKSAVGNEFTSDDIIWSVQRSLALKSTGAFFLGVANAADEAFWKATDRYTVVVTGTKPMANLCPLWTHEYTRNLAMFDSVDLKKHVTADDPWGMKWLVDHTSSYGPYYVTAWEPGKQAVMGANPNWYAGDLPFKKIIWQVVPESSGRVALLKAGNVDFIETISAEEAASLDGTPGVNTVSIRSNQELFAFLDNKAKPFDDVRVRTALNMAVSRDAIASGIFKGMAVPWQGVVPPIFPGYEKVTLFNTNVDQAKALLAEAGYPDGFSTELSYNQNDPVAESVAIALQTDFRKIGVAVALKKLTTPALTDYVFSGNMNFALWTDTPFLPDPVFGLNLWFSTVSVWPPKFKFEHPDLEVKLRACNDQLEWNARVECTKANAREVAALAPWVFIANPNYVYAASSHLTGLNWRPNLAYSIADGWGWKP